MYTDGGMSFYLPAQFTIFLRVSECVIIRFYVSCLQDVWRVRMLPIEFLFLTAYPVVDMRLRCKSSGIGYPHGIPPEISKVLDLEIVSKSYIYQSHHFCLHLLHNKFCIMQIKWELQGLDDIIKPSEFSLCVKGALYPDRRGSRSRLKGQLQMSISFVLPPVLSLVPEDIRRDVAESVRHLRPSCFLKAQLVS